MSTTSVKSYLYPAVALSGPRQVVKDAKHLIRCIKEDIEYYNHERIKLKLKGLSQIEYRHQALRAA